MPPAAWDHDAAVSATSSGWFGTMPTTIGWLLKGVILAELGCGASRWLIVQALLCCRPDPSGTGGLAAVSALVAGPGTGGGDCAADGGAPHHDDTTTLATMRTPLWAHIPAWGPRSRAWKDSYSQSLQHTSK